MPKKCLELLQKGSEIRKVNAFWAYRKKLSCYAQKFSQIWAPLDIFFLYAQTGPYTCRKSGNLV